MSTSPDRSAAWLRRWRNYIACAVCAAWGAVVTYGSEHYGTTWLTLTLGGSAGALALGRWIKNGD